MERKIYMIGNTHFDPVWLWTWDEAMASIRSTFRSALERMREYPNFKYSFSSPAVFEWIRDVDPDMFADIQERVSEGRWELVEGWWLQPDCYAASGESYVRQGLYGQRYLKKWFGKYSRTVFNADSFGHSPMLPQIARKSHMENYCVCRSAESVSRPLFRWQSPDGSQLMMYRYTCPFAPSVQEALDAQNQYPEMDNMILYGVTDHGGAPTKRHIEDIISFPNTVFSTVEEYFNSQRNAELPIVTEELLVKDYGPYANHTGIKKWSRTAERYLINAEKISVFSGRDHKESLTAAWKDTMFCQFHDIIGGASIPEAFIDARNQIGRAIQTSSECMHKDIQFMTKQICMPGNNTKNAWNLVLWNFSSLPYKGLVEAEVQWAHEFPWYDGEFVLEDLHNNLIPCQVITEHSAIPRFRSRILFRADVPAMGYTTYQLIQTPDKSAPLSYAKTEDENVFRTGLLEIRFNKSGYIEKVTRLCDGKTLCGTLFQPACFADAGDVWCFNTNDGYGECLEDFVLTDVRLTEEGALLTKIKCTYRFRNSILEMFYSFYTDENYIDTAYRLHWNEKHTVMKFLSDVTEECHRVSIPYGSFIRQSCTRDMPLGKWVTVNNITYLADGLFAYNLTNGQLGLTAVRSPIFGDLRIDPLDPDWEYTYMEQGLIEGNIRAAFSADSFSLSEAFHNPPVIVDEANHDGILSPEHSFCSLSAQHTLLTTIKYSEEGDGLILRFVETEGLSEEFILQYGNKEYMISINPFEIKTLRMEDCGIREVFMTED